MKAEKEEHLKSSTQENLKKIELKGDEKKKMKKEQSKKTITLMELSMIIQELDAMLKSIHPYYNQAKILNDHRSQEVLNGNYIEHFNSKSYNMDIFVGVVVKTKKYAQWPTKIWVKLRLKNNKYIAFL